LGLNLALNAAGTAIIEATPLDTVLFADLTKGDTISAINDEKVIAAARFEVDFAESNAARRSEIQRLVILNDPTRRDEHRVDLLAGELFRGFRHDQTLGTDCGAARLPRARQPRYARSSEPTRAKNAHPPPR